MKGFDFLFRRKAESVTEEKPAEMLPGTPAANLAASPVEKPRQEWRYGVAGNITKTHYDEQGVLRHGTSAFCGGAKVYLCGKYWEKGRNTIGVIGLDRCKRFTFTDVPPALIENVRCTKVYKPSVLKLMNHYEFTECWWDNTPAAKKEIRRFLQMWNEE